MALTKVSRGLLSTSIVDNGNATAITIDASENVGIGNSSPSSFNLVGADTLVVGSGSGEQGITIYSGTSNNGVLAFADGTTTTQQYQGYIGYNHSSNFMRFFTGATERMRIDSSGNVGIGSSSTDGRLKVSAASGASAAGSITLYGNNGGGFGGSNVVRSKIESKTDGTAFGANMLFYTNDTSNAYQERMRLSGGNLLVGTTSTSIDTSSNASGFNYKPGNCLTVATTVGGNSNIILNKTNSSQGNVVDIRYNGSIVGRIFASASGTQYIVSSDQRLKDNIVDAPSASGDIDAIQVRSFDWKADGSHQKYGMVAQELQGVAPEAVSIPDDPEEMAGVDYSKLVPMLVKEIQSLRSRVQQLENN